MSTKIYFCGSIQGGRQDAGIYAELIKKLQKFGTVLTEHVGNKNAKKPTTTVVERECVEGDEGLSPKEIHDRDVEWLKSADVVVAECTVPSLGVGYEIGTARLLGGKKILCLFRPGATHKALSCMIDGAADDKNFMVRNYDYEKSEVDAIFEEFFKSV